MLREQIFVRENCDLYSVNETHLADEGEFEPKVEGYTFKGYNRSLVHRRAPKVRGGVGFLIKNTVLSDYTFSIVDKTYDGIMVIDLTHKIIGTKLLFASCYLPPENSPYGRNATGFLNHLSSICYSQSNVYDRLYFCGDLNARVGDLQDCTPDIDIELPKRSCIDTIENNHGKSLIEFLNDNKLCILNGRFDPTKDNYTYVSGNGSSVVDYIICPHDNFTFCNDFKVILSSELANQYNLQSLIKPKGKLPDHSLLKVKIVISDTCTPVDNINSASCNPSYGDTLKHNVNNIPADFMNNEEARNKLLHLIEVQELCRESQANVDDCYDKLLGYLYDEMNKYLPKMGVKTTKSLKMKKPYWNANLMSLWKLMCSKESEYLRYRGPHHVRKMLKSRFSDASKTFHRALRKAEREYNKLLQNRIESVCTEDPKKFWTYIKKLGPKSKNTIPQEVYNEDGEIVTDLNFVLNKWKNEYEMLYKPTCDTFDNNFYSQVRELLRIAENRMIDPLYVENPDLNGNISRQEVDSVINRLKNRKAVGIDKIPNEILRTDNVRNCLHRFFQYYFDTGLLPTHWLKAVIKPIPKNKTNDPKIPLNYRGVNLLSCIYKSYSCIINKRLSSYLERYHLIEDEQNGFREGRSCLEHIYTLYSIIKNRKNQSKDTFVAFVDFTKCFDLIDRDILFYKLTEYGIDGKMYQTLKRMYSNTMSCVNINNTLTDWFYTMNGCRQGDVTSPTAFSIVINDLIKELKYTGLGVEVNDLTVCVLAYADDIALIADTPGNLQKLISKMHEWCNKWRFIVNPSKSNIVHFRNPPKAQTAFKFTLGNSGTELQVVESYKYLGVILDQYLTFAKATQTLSNAAGRALGGMICKYKSMKEMGYSTYSKLFTAMVTPVMDYGSAIWGGKSYDSMNNVINRAQRFFTGVHRLCPVDGFTVDMGWASNRVRWKLDTLTLWNRLIGTDKDRLLFKVFQWDMTCHNNDNKGNFASNVKQILCEIKQKNVYKDMTVVNIDHAKKCLMDNLEVEWRNSVQKKTKLELYNVLKCNYGVEKYLLLNIDKYEKSLLSQLRYGILPLRIETGRYVNETREERVCTLCTSNTIESVEHFLFECEAYDTLRLPFVTNAQSVIENWEDLTQTECLKLLFELMPRALARYVKNIFLHRREKIYK